MIKKLITILLVTVMLMPSFRVAALEKSIKEVSEELAVTNNDTSVVIPYNDVTARVYYGLNGIDVFTPDGRNHFDTNYEVLKLISVGDVDGDGYADLLTVQKTPEQVSQMLVISSYDGHVISSFRMDRDGYDETQGGFIKVNSYVQQMEAVGDNSVLVVYDYNIVKINAVDGSEIWRYTDTDNIWKIVTVGDLNEDGVNDIAYSGQQNMLGVVSGSDGTLIKSYNPADPYSVSLPWNNEATMDVTFNVWDIRYEGNLLYVLSENRNLYVYDLTTEEGLVNMVKLDVMEDEMFDNRLSEQIEYVGGKEQYHVSGVINWVYMGLRFADSNDEYLMVNAYMGDKNSAASYVDATYGSKILVINKETLETVATINLNEVGAMYQKTALGKYGEDTVVAAVSHIEEGLGKLSLYNLEGNLLLQKDIKTSGFSNNNKLELSFNEEEGYRLELFNGGCFIISADLKTVNAAYKSSTTEVLEFNKDYILTAISNNNIKNKIAKYDTDGETLIWQYTANQNFNHRGFEKIRTDIDFNRDGVRDVMIIMNHYDGNDSKGFSYFLVLDGNNGNVLVGKVVETGYYYNDKNQRITTYLTGNDIGVFRDLDGDGVYELNVDGNIVAGRRNEVVGSINGYVEAEGNQFPVGDCNGDGVTDYVVISRKETRLYLSKTTYSYRVLEVTYQKTNTYFGNADKCQAESTSALIGDINRDGVKEIGMVDYNAAGHEVFKVVNGANLSVMYYLCPNGLKGNGEAFVSTGQDINGDGYNEIYGMQAWQYGIYDGKTGELGCVFSVDNYYWEDEYYPDYLIPFTVLEGAPPVYIVIDDANGDGFRDLAYCTNYNNDDFEMITSIFIISGADFSTYDEIVIGKNNYDENISSLMEIKNSTNLVAILSEGQSTRVKLYDLSKGGELASFDGNLSDLCVGKDGRMLAVKDKKLYTLNIEPSFTMTGEIPQSTDNYVLPLSWDTLQDYSVMTISDNGTVVYRGQDSSYQLKLMEGNHTVKLSMNDGQGKIYSECYDVTVQPQEKNFVLPAVVTGVTVILSILLGIFQKWKINRRFKKGGKK